MTRVAAVLGVFLLAAAGPAAAQLIDLSAPSALEQVRASNPEHLEKIAQIVAGLREQPGRAEGDWLQKTFGAREVDLAPLVTPTSNPPKQVLEFALDDVRYQLTLVRSDSGPDIKQLQEQLRRELARRPVDPLSQTLLP